MKQRGTRLKRVTTQRRIMLLLFDYHKYIDSYDVPEAVSQNGIASELSLRQTHVSRALTELVSDGLIFSRSSHIKDVPRRRQVYFLTEKGTKDISKFIGEISSNTVLVHTPSDELKEYTLEEVAKSLREYVGQIPSYHQIITKYYKNNEIDINFLAKHPDADLKKLKKLNIPLDKRFYGRTTECDSIFKAIDSGRFKFIIINSIAGQGKTALMVRIVSNITDRPILWSTLNEWVLPSNLLNDWAYFFKEHKKTNLYNYIDTTSQFNLQDACKAFIKDSKALQQIVVIDDFHKATFEVVKMFRLIKTLLSTDDQTVFLIASREQPGFYGKKDMLESNQIYELELRGLDLESALKILKEKDIPEPEFKVAYEITQGHPLALELYSPSFFTDSKLQTMEFDTFIGEEVIAYLTGAEIEVIKLASLFPRPVHGRAFFFRSEINQEVLDKLCSKLILRVYQNGKYDIHDLVKSYFLNRMTAFEKERYLEIAYEYYSTCDSEKDILDYLRILHDSDQRSRFLETLLDNGDFLLSHGYTQVGEYIQELDISDISGLNRIKLSILKSDESLSRGKLAQARTMLKNGLELCDKLLQFQIKTPRSEFEKEEIVQLISRIYNRSAEISKLEGHMDDTIKEYNKSVVLNQKYGDNAGLGKALNNLAMAYRERGQLDLALETLTKADKVFNELGDQSACALVQVNIGDIYFLKRDVDKATKYFKIAEQASARIPEVKGAIYKKIGTVRLQLGQLSTAHQALLEALNAYKKANDWNNRLRVLSTLFDCAKQLHKKEIAEWYLKSASKLLEDHLKDSIDTELMNGFINQQLKDKLIFSILWSPQDLQEQISQYVTHHSRTGDARAFLDDLEELSKHKEFENNFNALSMLYDSVGKYFLTLSDKHPFIIINIQKANLLHKLDRNKEARTVLQNVLPMAKRIGFNKAIQRIEDMMRKI